MAEHANPYNAMLRGGEISSQNSLAFPEEVDSLSLAQTHFYEEINSDKVAELKFTNRVVTATRTSHAMNSQWGNWRAARDVNPRVRLFLESQKLSYSIRHQFEKAFDSLLDKGAVNKIEGILETARVLVAGNANQNYTHTGGQFRSKYANVPAWKHTDPLSFNGDLKFSFAFGQSGLFDAKKEVVDPIISIALNFGVSIMPAEGDTGNYVVGPAPTLNFYTAQMLKSLSTDFIGKLRDMSKSIAARNKANDGTPINELNEDERNANRGFVTAINALTEIQAAAYKAVDDGIIAGMTTGHGLKTFFIRVGRYSAGPFVASNISWNFDFEQTDANGAPWKGDITISGIESLYYPHETLIANTGKPVFIERSITDEDVDESIILDAVSMDADFNTESPSTVQARQARLDLETDDAYIEALRNLDRHLKDWYDAERRVRWLAVNGNGTRNTGNPSMANMSESAAEARKTSAVAGIEEAFNALVRIDGSLRTEMMQRIRTPAGTGDTLPWPSNWTRRPL